MTRMKSSSFRSSKFFFVRVTDKPSKTSSEPYNFDSIIGLSVVVLNL